MKKSVSILLVATIKGQGLFGVNEGNKYDSMLGRFLSGDEESGDPTYHLPNRDDLTRDEK